MNTFEYATPSSVEEAVSLLGQTWGESELLAGGTDLVTSLKQGVVSPKRVVSLRNVGLRGISAEDETVEIGAMTTLGDLSENDIIREHFPALARAAANVASPQMLSMGTVGGDLCQRPRCWYFRNGFGLLGQKDGMSLPAQGDNRYHAIFGNSGPAKFVSASSLGPPLVALGARVVTSARTLDASEFFTTPRAETDRETALEPNEIVTAVRVPLHGAANATYEIRHRKGLDWPYVTASVAFRFADRKAPTSARVVLGHVAPVPWVAARAAEGLNDNALTADAADACGAAAAEGAHPLTGNAYKIAMVKTAVKRAVLIAAGLLPDPA